MIGDIMIANSLIKGGYMERKLTCAWRKTICVAALGVFFAFFGIPRVCFGDDLPMAKPEEVGLSSARLARIGPAMDRYIEKNLISGSVTLVARKGKVAHLEARGLKNVQAKQAMTTDTIFRLASMTKPITTVACMMLYEEGHFLLSDPIKKWIPEFANPVVRTLPGRYLCGAVRDGPGQERHNDPAASDSYCWVVQCLPRDQPGGVYQIPGVAG